MNDIILHNYFRSSTSYRVRAALHLKDVEYQYVSHHLRKGDQGSKFFLSKNAQGLVPVLEIHGACLSQSLAILEYLEEIYPDPPLIPSDALGRARVRSLSMLIGCDIHPLNNLRVLKYISDHFNAIEEDVSNWFCHWVEQGFNALESRLKSESETGRFCHGDAISIADICLVAQVINNRRFKFDMSGYPLIQMIYENCMSHDAFSKALPNKQPDAE